MMDIIMVCDAANRHSSACRRTSTFTHRSRLLLEGGVRRVYFVLMADPLELAKAIDIALSDNDISDDFILTYDTTFLLSDYDPSIPRVREKFAKRKGKAVDQMVNTLNFLLQGGFPTYDYELQVPAVLNKHRVSQIMDIHGVHDMMFRSLYFNTFYDGGERMADPMLDLWIHSMDPQGPVVSLGPTALQHKKCRQWVSKLDK
jgi:hypothetical protein